MTERILGPTGSPRRRRWLGVPIALVFAVAMFWIAGAQAVHDTGLFELDGNAVNGPATGDDWDNVCHQVTITNDTGSTIPDECASAANTTGSNAVSWASDGSQNATIFTGGGSKDPQDINQWAWKDGAGGLPDKDNLQHSFAVRYSQPPSATCPSGTASTCDILYFGSDRFDNSGDAQQGFWFFQNAVGLGTNAVGGGQGFTGVHRNGDLLVISDFSNGGTTSTISVYKWNSAVSGNLQLLASSDAANCSTAAALDAFCGIVNPGPAHTAAPWLFTDKSGNHDYLNGEFYEGGINLSLLGLASECFASVASESRSSTSTTATLKDFVLGGFGRCDTTLATTPKDGAGAAIPAGGLSIGTGSVSVKDSATLTINGVTTWSGTLKFFLCNPSETTLNASNEAVCAGTAGTQIGPAAGVTVANTDAQPFLSAAATVTSAGTYCWRSTFTHITTGVPDASDASHGECFTVNPVTPTIPTTASGTVEIGGNVSDSAALSGTANKPGTPIVNPTTAGAAAGGSITFRLYGPSASAVCNDANLVFTSSAIPVSDDASYGSGNFTPTSAGTYRWIASYTGDSPNTNAAAGTCGASNETVIVTPKQPSITTDASADPPTGVSLGTAIHDSATLSGAAAGAGGTITFRLYGPSDTAVCDATNLVFTSAAIPVTGNGTYQSGDYTPTAIGTYRWIASYSGDLPNTLPVAGACSDAGEASLIFSLTPTVATSQFFYPNDSATITVSNADGALAGSVRLRAWTNNTCNGTPLVDETIDVTTGTGATDYAKTVETTNTTHRVSGDVSIYWQVDYDSTNPAQNDVAGTCGMETSTIDVTDLS